MLHTGSDVSCNYNKGFCMDAIHGLTYWSINDNVDCANKNYNVLYYGKSEKAYIKSHYDGHDKIETIFTVDQSNMIFALIV